MSCKAGTNGELSQTIISVNNPNIFSPGRDLTFDSATVNRLRYVEKKNSAWNSNAAMVCQR